MTPQSDRIHPEIFLDRWIRTLRSGRHLGYPYRQSPNGELKVWIPGPGYCHSPLGVAAEVVIDLHPRSCGYELMTVDYVFRGNDVVREMFQVSDELRDSHLFRFAQRCHLYRPGEEPVCLPVDSPQARKFDLPQTADLLQAARTAGHLHGIEPQNGDSAPAGRIDNPPELATRPDSGVLRPIAPPEDGGTALR